MNIDLSSEQYKELNKLKDAYDTKFKEVFKACDEFVQEFSPAIDDFPDNKRKIAGSAAFCASLMVNFSKNYNFQLQDELVVMCLMLNSHLHFIECIYNGFKESKEGFVLSIIDSLIRSSNISKESLLKILVDEKDKKEAH